MAQGAFKKTSHTQSETKLSHKTKKPVAVKAGTVVRKMKLGKAAIKAKAIIGKLTAGSINRCEAQLAVKAGKMRIVTNPVKAVAKDVKGMKKR